MVFLFVFGAFVERRKAAFAKAKNSLRNREPCVPPTVDYIDKQNRVYMREPNAAIICGGTRMTVK